MPPPSDDIGGAPPPSAGLLRQLAPAPTEPELRLRRGIVQALAADATCTVRPSGSEDPADDIPGVAYYAHVEPRVGDVVELLAHGADWRAIGVVARPDQPSRRVRHTASTVVGATTYVTNGWEVFDIANTDMVLPARVGDLIEVTFTITAGTGTNPPSWRPSFTVAGVLGREFEPYHGQHPANTLLSLTMVWAEVVTPDDLDGAEVRVRVRWNNPAANTIYASASIPARFRARNLGPPL